MERAIAKADVFIRDRTTWLAYLALGCFSYLATLPGPIMPFLRAELRLSYGLASLHFSALALGSICIGVVGARLTGRLGRHRTFWGGAIGMAAGAGLLTWSPWVIGTISGAGVMGLAGTLLLVTVQAILADRHAERRTIAFAESNVVAGACSILATLAVGGLARTTWGWRSSVWFAFVALAALGIAFRRERLAEGAASKEARRTAVTAQLPRRLWAYWIVMLLGGSVEWCIVFWGTTFFELAVGLEKTVAATTMSLFFGAIVLGRFVGSRLARSVESSTLLLLAQGITLIGFPLFWLASRDSLNVIGLVIAGVGIGNFYPMTLALAVSTAPHLPEQVSARLTLAVGLAALVAPLVLGWLADRVAIQQAYTVVLPLLIAAGLVAASAGKLSATNPP